MIDYTKPIRMLKVLMLADDGGAWVQTGDETARLFDRDGKCHGFKDIENVPEEPKPIVSWVLIWYDGTGSASSSESHSRDVFANNMLNSKALIKLTYTHGNGATVEVVEERK